MPPRGQHHAQRRAHRQRAFRRAKWLSQMLLRSLGGACAICGIEDLSLLTVDHVERITWDRYALRYDARVARYIEEFCAGVALRCLCMSCNGRLGQALQWAAQPGDDVDELLLDREPTHDLPDAPF